MCKYCNYSFDDGWTRLLRYDEVYQSAMRRETERSTHGFYESWDELRDQLISQ
jgi:hypothetical protein